MTESLVSQADAQQIDFEVTAPLEKNNPTARFLNIFVGRSFPVEAHEILRRESVGEEGLDVVNISTKMIKERLIATEDSAALDSLEEIKGQQITGFCFPVSMGHFIDRESGRVIRIEEIATS